MNTAKLIHDTILFVKQTLADAEGGHDWFHIERVYKNALLIASSESCDTLVVQLGALLHDIADSKFHNGDETIGPKTARKFLEEHQVSEETISHVVQIIANISFKGGKTKRSFSSIELDIVQDADRLDAIGAIGIARAFNYGGFKNRALYNPEIAPNLHMTKEEYKNKSSTNYQSFLREIIVAR